ncbi:VOC family protein [Pseudomonas sp. RIT-PI-AD]|uniref:bleomycin resistance protein n=1 Tax=Pseudomonas sp. RIT-PI-AD TaxID=3035294 RepID=UPI0021DAF200|nr:VOC family protein [Pseudomonas sp. RIT-PI-AD]
MSASILTTVPVLASLDLDQSRVFYAERLGFETCLQTADCLIVERDGAELHFWPCPERHLAENTSCYVRCADVEALHREFAERGLPLAPPVLRPWGMRELYVIDPHGNLLKFGEPADVPA